MLFLPNTNSTVLKRKYSTQIQFLANPTKYPTITLSEKAIKNFGTFKLKFLSYEMPFGMIFF